MVTALGKDTVSRIYRYADVFHSDLIIKIYYTSWLADAISNFNSDLYYQPRDYILECYKEDEIVA